MVLIVFCQSGLLKQPHSPEGGDSLGFICEAVWMGPQIRDLRPFGLCFLCPLRDPSPGLQQARL